MTSTGSWVEVVAIPSNISFGTLQVTALENSGVEATLEIAIGTDLATLAAVNNTAYNQLKARGSYAGFGQLVVGGEIDAVRLVGPSTPATKRGLAGFCAVNSSHSRRASLAPSKFSS